MMKLKKLHSYQPGHTKKITQNRHTTPSDIHTHSNKKQFTQINNHPCKEDLSLLTHTTHSFVSSVYGASFTILLRNTSSLSFFVFAHKDIGMLSHIWWTYKVKSKCEVQEAIAIVCFSPLHQNEMVKITFQCVHFFEILKVLKGF